MCGDERKRNLRLVEAMSNEMIDARQKLAMAFFVMCWLLSPIAGALVLYVFCFLVIRNQRACVFSCIIVGLTLGLLSYCSQQGSMMACDIIRYRDQWETYIDRPYGEMFGPNILFDSINWFLANYLLSDSRWVGFFWVTISTSVYLSACTLMIFSVVRKKKDDIIFIAGITCLIIIPFTIINELLKQTVAVSFILMAISLSYLRRPGAVICIIVALLTHVTSTVLFFPIVFWRNKFVRKYIKVFTLVSIGLGMINIVMVMNTILAHIPIVRVMGLALALENYASFDSWGGSKRFYLGFAFFIFQLVYVFAHTYRMQRFINLRIILLLIFCTIMINFSNVHNFARLINTLYPFNALALIVGILESKSSSARLLLALVTGTSLFVSSLIQIHSNISHNYFVTYMNNDILQLLSSNIIDFLEV